MDERAHAALEDFVREIVSRDLDELYARLDRLEQQLAAPRNFSRAALDRQRREAVLHARRQGLSIGLIADALGLATNTVARIVANGDAPELDYVVGRDGKRQPARHDWGPQIGRRNGA